VLGLSLLLLTDGLPVGLAHVTVASEDPDQVIEPPEDISGYTCASGFADIDSKVETSLHGVTLVKYGALAVGFTRRRDSAEFGRRRPAAVFNRTGVWERVWADSPGAEDGLMAVAAKRGALAWAVGFTTIRGRVMPLAMRWDGEEWVTDRPRPRGKLTSVFTDVAIVGHSDPFAVGYRATASGARQPIAARKADGRWRYVPIRTGRRESVTLTGVDADGRRGVWVVGHGGRGTQTKPVIYHGVGQRWLRVKAPTPRGEAALTGVASTGRSEAWAVGYHHRDGRSVPLVLRWNGRKWRRAPAPAFGSGQAMLSAVTADPTGGVWVVGAAWDEDRRSHVAVAAWWDGRAWNEVSGPAGGTELHDVVGSLDAEGWAVGRSGNSSRATRVCTPAQSGIFGGVEPGEMEPLPSPGLTAGRGDDEEATATARSGSADEAAAESTLPAAKQKKQSPAKRAKARRASKTRRLKVRTGTLPVTRTDGDIVAHDVARQAGVFEDTGTYDAVVADFDGDGDDDLYVGRHGRRGRLLLNDDGVFVEHEALKMPSIDRHGCAAADIDGSGLPDLYCAVGGRRGTGLKSNELWIDPGGPAPREGAAERGLSDPTGRGRLAGFLEARKQKGVSLVVTNSPDRVDGLPSLGRRFVTHRDGDFAAVAEPGFAAQLGALAVQDADFDRDGREDLLLVTGRPQAPGRGGTRLYRNTRGGLVDVTAKMGIEHFDEIDAELVDVDRDGKLDLVQLSGTKLRVSRLERGRFRMVYEAALSHGRALAGGDVNGDGRGDLYIVRSNSKRNYPDVMLVNRGSGARWSSLSIPQVSAGDGEDAYAIDHDGNGLDDFIVLNGHNSRGPTQLVAFYRRKG
jgi:hypothetical protein